MEVTNPFETEEEASRYEKYRPQYHYIPLNKVREFVGKDFGYSLDVACGTGHSTIALSKISKEVVGCDLSETMLSEARKNTDIEFIQSCAETLPFAENTFDFLNISMGFHWVEQSRFLSEAERVLNNGFLSVDNYGFLGQISEDSEKQKMHFEFFEKYLPPASRRSGYPSEELIGSTHFNLMKEIQYDHLVELDETQFVNLIMTWSNFQVQEKARQAQTLSKMEEVYGKIFEGEKLTLKFGGKTLLYGM